MLTPSHGKLGRGGGRVLSMNFQAYVMFQELLWKAEQKWRDVKAAIGDDGDFHVNGISGESLGNRDFLLIGIGRDINFLGQLDSGQVAGYFVGDAVIEQVNENPNRA